MSDPDRWQERLPRLEQRNGGLADRISRAEDAVHAARVTLTARVLALGVLLASAMPWFSHTGVENQPGDSHSALGMLRSVPSVVDGATIRVAVVGLVVGALAAMVVPAEGRWSALTGGAVLLAVLVVLGAVPHGEADGSRFSWSEAPYLALVLALALAVLQLTAKKER